LQHRGRERPGTVDERHQHGLRFVGALGSVGTDLRRAMAPPAPAKGGVRPLPHLIRIAGCRRQGRMQTKLCGEG
jgi:hypothetical protein